jgi:acyl carrier protein
LTDGLLGRVQRIVERQAGVSRTPPDASPDTALGEGGFWLDSVDLLDVIVASEQAFGVSFDGEVDLTPETLTTIRSLAALIRSKGGR